MTEDNSHSPNSSFSLSSPFGSPSKSFSNFEGNDFQSHSQLEDFNPSNVLEDLKLPLCFQKYSNEFTFNMRRISDDIIYYNAHPESFYSNPKIKPENPQFKIWILSSLSSSDKLSYPNKRIFEESFIQNISVEIKQISNFNIIMSQSGLKHIYYNHEIVEESDLPDAVLPRLGSKVSQHGLSVIRQLETMDILVLNNFSSIDISRNKLYTMQTLASYNLPIPKTMIAQPPFQLKMIEKEFKFPLVLKRTSGSQGKGAMLIAEASMLEDVSDMVSDSPSALIFQEYIEHSKGRDLRVFVVGGRVIGPGKGMMREAINGFKANVPSSRRKSVKLSTTVEWLAIETSRLLGLDVSGVDILIDADTYKISEVHASPGFESFELTTGCNVPKQLLEFLQLRLGLWRNKGKKNPHFLKIKPNEQELQSQKS